MALDPTDAGAVETALGSFLAGHLCIPTVSFAEPPVPVLHGWDTYLYFFRLDAASGALAPEWTRPLVLRLYAAPDQWERAHEEVAIQRFVVDRGFPAPRPLALGDAAGPFGLPFMIMERLPGRTMIDHIGFNPTRVPKTFAGMAALHAQLHRLPVDGWPLTDDGSPLVDRFLELLRADAERLGVHDADSALDWLQQQRSTVIPEERSLCHGDFHPLNILVESADRMSVVDWGLAMVGDRHSDVANALALVRLVPTGSIGGRAQQAVAGVLRRWAARRYLAAYRALLPLDDARLRYWETFHAVRWWVAFSVFLSRGSAAAGLKPESTRFVRPEHVAIFRRRFEELAHA